MRLFNFFAIMFLLVGALAFSACTDTEYVDVPGDPVTVPGDPVTVPGDPVTVPGDPVFECLDGTSAPSLEECPDFYEEIGMVEEGGCWDEGDGNDRLKGNEMANCIDGMGGNDAIKGLGGDDTLIGGTGDDTLYGGPGNDELTGGSGNNMLNGGDGEDIAIYKDVMRVVADLSNNMARIQHASPEMVDPLIETGDSGIGTDTLIEIENVKGSLAGADTITGDDNANVLKGLDGADTLNGGDGDDMILPNRPVEMDADGMAIENVADPASADGVDVVDGGEGSDTINYEGESGDVTVALATIVPAAGTDTDTLTDDVIAHVAAEVSGFGTDMIVLVDRGTTDDPKLESTIENVIGGFGGDALTGDVRGNMLTGGAGDDTLNGEADPAAEATTMGGADTLNGGAGDDELNGGPGNDILDGGAGTDTLNGNAGDDMLDGGSGTDTLNGGAGDDQYIITKDDADTISEFAAGDKISLKGFMGDEKLVIDGTALQVVDPDDSSDTTDIATISTGANLIRLTQDVEFID